MEEGSMLSTLDVGKLPQHAHYGTDTRETDLAYEVTRMRTTIGLWEQIKLVKPNKSFSLGFAAARPKLNPVRPEWDDPYDFVWFVAGWGPDGDRYIANAVRKLRPSLRTGRDTLDLRLAKSDQFEDVVESAVDGKFPWGDFPYGGATIVRTGNIILPCAVSGFHEVEDDTAAKAIGGRIGSTMLQMDYPELFAA
jgi:hypothetical protein